MRREQFNVPAYPCHSVSFTPSHTLSFEAVASRMRTQVAGLYLENLGRTNLRGPQFAARPAQRAARRPRAQAACSGAWCAPARPCGPRRMRSGPGGASRVSQNTCCYRRLRGGSIGGLRGGGRRPPPRPPGRGEGGSRAASRRDPGRGVGGSPGS